MQPQFLTTQEVAQILRKSQRTVQRLVQSGALVPAQKLAGPNGAYLFTQAAVASLLASDDEPETSAAAAS